MAGWVGPLPCFVPFLLSSPECWVLLLLLILIPRALFVLLDLRVPSLRPSCILERHLIARLLLVAQMFTETRNLHVIMTGVYVCAFYLFFFSLLFLQLAAGQGLKPLALKKIEIKSHNTGLQRRI